MEMHVREGQLIPVVEAPRRKEKDLDPFHLPYKTFICFGPLIERIEQLADGPNAGDAFLARQVLERLEAAPELRAPIKDEQLLERHTDLISMLVSFVSPLALHDQHLVKVMPPFRLRPIYSSPAMQKLLSCEDVHYIIDGTDTTVFDTTIIRAGSQILKKFYDQHFDFDLPIVLSVRPEGSDLVHYYKTQMDLDFLDIEAVKPLKPLSQEEIDHMLVNIYDMDLWLKNLPPENFVFHGIIVGQLLDITDEETLSRLKHKLLKRDAILTRQSIEELEQVLRTYFSIEDLQLGITAIDYPVKHTPVHRYNIRFNFLAEEVDDLLDARYAGSIYERVCSYREILLIEDLRRLKRGTGLADKLINKGLRSIIIAPLLNKQERVIGLVELGSPRPFVLNSLVELKFKEMTGLFRTAMERGRDEIDSRIESIIRENYTALHPSVEWRFVEAAFSLLEKQEEHRSVQAEPIQFSNIFPLYGQADIVGSSTQRNESIRLDLLATLESARSVLENSLRVVRFPLVDQSIMHLDRQMAHLQDNFVSSDETRLAELLHQEVNPLIRQLGREHRQLRSHTERYFSQLDPSLELINQHRRAYEQSVEIINGVISNYLDEQQVEMQAALPHYFEKYKTDGVEYDIYVGQSLLRHDQFSEIHLRNFRLWQVVQMCEITRLIANLQGALPLPLTTAQLIFAYTTPISISFRMDEKQFDVDGAYNVRYEILKKRIDKAVLDGGAERLTQAGKVAIVYLHEKDRQEYMNYLEYLQQAGYISGEVEDLSLAPVQGVQGLRALRVAVVVD